MSTSVLTVDAGAILAEHQRCMSAVEMCHVAAGSNYQDSFSQRPFCHSACTHTRSDRYTCIVYRQTGTTMKTKLFRQAH